VRVLILGAAGIVGGAMRAECARRGWPTAAAGRERVDVTRRDRVAEAIAGASAELVVNCAALTRVDDCETERELAFRVNGEGAGIAAEEAARAGARAIQISTDYVFDGLGEAPYREDHPTAPRSVYGASKLDGELRSLAAGALVVRTSWIFGRGGPNFVDAIRRRVESGSEPLRVVDDQLGAPTWAPFLARALADLGESGSGGIVHYQNREPVTWYGFACEIARQLGRPVEIRPVTSAEFPRPAPRPAYSVLDVARFEALAGRRVELWSEGLAAHLGSSEERR